jgi:hypothetical protein
VKLNASRNSGTLKTDGSNTIQSPVGPFTQPVQMSFTLRSVTNCG